MKSPEVLIRRGHEVGIRVRALWERWRRWEYRYEVLVFGVIGFLLLVFLWFLFTGTVARRH